MLRVARNDAEGNNIAFKGLDVVRQYDSKFFKTALDAPLYAVSAGRSMIEMLGVLAIVGVLSVGGIAGYSKAMEKWKINRMQNEYSYLIAGLLEHINDIKKLNSEESQYGLVSFVQAAHLVPETWKKLRDDVDFQITDTYGNIIQIFVRRNNLAIDLYLGGFSKDENDKSASLSFSQNVCFTLMQNVVQPLSSSLEFAKMTHQYQISYYGNSSCTSDRQCIKDLTFSKIKEICGSCTKKSEAFCGILLEF